MTVSTALRRELDEQFRLPSDILIKFGLIDYDRSPISVNYSEDYFGNSSQAHTIGMPWQTEKTVNLVNDETYGFLLCSMNSEIIGNHNWARQAVHPTDDGSLNFNPSPYQGFVSKALSNNNCEFEEEQFIEFTYANAINFFGYTLNFDPVMHTRPEKIRFKTWVNDDLTLDKVYDIDSYSFAIHELLHYDKVRISWIKTSFPRQRAKLSHILHGVGLEFTAYNIAAEGGTTWTENIDTISRRLPVQEFSFNIINENGKFNIDNPDGVWMFVKEQQIIEVFYRQRIRIEYQESGREFEEIKAGSFMITGRPNVTRNKISFRANGRLNFATQELSLRPFALTPSTSFRPLMDYVQNLVPFDFPIRNLWETLPFQAWFVGVNYFPKIQLRDFLRLSAEAFTSRLFEDENAIINIGDGFTGDFSPNDNILQFITDRHMRARDIKLNSLKVRTNPKLRNLVINIYNYQMENQEQEIHRIVINNTESDIDGYSEQLFYDDIWEPRIEYWENGEFMFNLNTSQVSFQMGGAFVNLERIIPINAELVLFGKRVTENIRQKNYRVNQDGEDIIIMNPLIQNEFIANQVAEWKINYYSNEIIYESEDYGDPTHRSGDIIKKETEFTYKLPVRTVERITKWNNQSFSGSGIYKVVDFDDN